MEQLRLLSLAEPGSQRWSYWQQLNISTELIPWQQVIIDEGQLARSFDSLLKQPCYLRFESPGSDFAISKGFLNAGNLATNDNSTDWLTWPEKFGCLVRPGLLYAGFKHILNNLHRSLQHYPQLYPLSCPLAIAEMFDKNTSIARLHKAGIPTPPTFKPVTNSQILFKELKNRGWKKAYIKLAYGSSASGIIVIDNIATTPSAITSMVKIKQAFYNTYKLRRITGQQLHSALDFLIKEGATAQKAIPMAQITGQNFDVRVIMIAAKPEFFIFRLSAQPMTNLHLGGRRGYFDYCRQQIPNRIWLDAMDHCIAAAKLYDSWVIGIDLLFERDYNHYYIIELNAFGDFFPNLTNKQGLSVPEVILNSLQLGKLSLSSDE